MNKKSKTDFDRIRSDHRTEIAEDYVEAIAEFQTQKGVCRGSDLARHFSVSHATVTQTLARLKEVGFVESEPYGPVSLTRRGKKIAEQSRDRHEVVLSFLLALGVSEAVAAADTEGIEHHVSDETLDCFRQFLKKSAGTRTPKEVARKG